jgi:hypothetical protein
MVEGNALYLDLEEEIRFKVEEETFVDQTPTSAPDSRTIEEESRVAPYSLIVTFNFVIFHESDMVIGIVYGFWSWSHWMVVMIRRERLGRSETEGKRVRE